MNEKPSYSLNIKKTPFDCHIVAIEGRLFEWATSA